MAAKFTVSELAKMMGKPAKEVLFLLQGIGVDVKTVESVLDPGTAQAILTGKTQAPKSLIVRQAPTAAAPAVAAVKPKTERAALPGVRIERRDRDPRRRDRRRARRHARSCDPLSRCHREKGRDDRKQHHL